MMIMVTMVVTHYRNCFDSNLLFCMSHSEWQCHNVITIMWSEESIRRGRAEYWLTTLLILVTCQSDCVEVKDGVSNYFFFFILREGHLIYFGFPSTNTF